MKGQLKKIIPGFLLNGYHFLFALGAALFYNFPSRKIKVIGVTGTNGKSTTIDLIAAILEEMGFKIAVLSSIEFKIAGKREENRLRMTMPGRATVQRFLYQAVKAGCQYAVLEVTSEGVKQHRHRFISFEAGIFTNLTPEHIEAHGDFSRYRLAKLKFFKTVKNIQIINQDDANADYFLETGASRVFQYGLKQIIGPELHLKVADLFAGPEGVAFLVEKTQFRLSLLGRFNIYNALAAISLGLSQGGELEICARALAKVKTPPGRMELIINSPFKVLVDYAFTPNALKQVYQTLTENYKLKANKLICVLGACGGGRDKWKRPVLGKLASQYCDRVIITNEDPYDEDPEEIISQVAAGAGAKAEKFLQRREAIRRALFLAEPQDVVVITGKGSEPSICLAGGKRIDWDDREVARQELAGLQLMINKQ